LGVRCGSLNRGYEREASWWRAKIFFLGEVRGIFDEEEDEEGRCLAYGMEMGMEVKREVDSRLAS
jgi:hypothetical protein